MINGEWLNEAQAKTIRVALAAFAATLQKGLGEDEQGRGMVECYSRCVDEIRLMMRRR